MQSPKLYVVYSIHLQQYHGTVQPAAHFNSETDAAALRKAMKGLGKACMHVNLSVIQNNVYEDSDISSKNRTLAFLIPLINVFYEKRTI